MQKDIIWGVSKTNGKHNSPHYLTNSQLAGPWDNVSGGRCLEPFLSTEEPYAQGRA